MYGTHHQQQPSFEIVSSMHSTTTTRKKKSSHYLEDYANRMTKYDYCVNGQQEKAQKRQKFKPFKKTQIKVKEEPIVYNLLRKEEIKTMSEAQFNNKVCGLSDGVVYEIEYDDDKIGRETLNGWCK